MWINFNTKFNNASNFVFHCKKARQKFPVNTSTSSQCWSSMFINVVSTLKFGWNWKLSRCNVYRPCFNADKRTLKQHWENYINSMPMTQCCFNVDIWLKMKVESTYVHRRCFDVEKTALKQLCQLLYWSVLMFTRKWFKNKTKLSF